MENASKALIIAGAILLSVLIIGLGMYIYNMAADAITDTGLDKTKIQAHNEPYDRYLGTRSGTDVRTLVKNVTTNNNSHPDDETQQIAVVFGSSAAGITDVNNRGSGYLSVADIQTNVLTKIKAGLTYTVDFGYDAKSGLIIAVGIQEKK